VSRSVYKLVPLAEVVAHWRLIEDVGDDTVQLRAEGIVGFGVCKSAGSERANILGCSIGLGDVIERSVVDGIQCPHGGVSCDARVASGTEDVARSLRGSLGGSAKCNGEKNVA
jgi:hypothetical protein